MEGDINIFSLLELVKIILENTSNSMKMDDKLVQSLVDVNAGLSSKCDAPCVEHVQEGLKALDVKQTFSGENTVALFELNYFMMLCTTSMSVRDSVFHQSMSSD